MLFDNQKYNLSVYIMYVYIALQHAITHRNVQVVDILIEDTRIGTYLLFY